MANKIRVLRFIAGTAATGALAAIPMATTVVVKAPAAQATPIAAASAPAFQPAWHHRHWGWGPGPGWGWGPGPGWGSGWGFPFGWGTGSGIGLPGIFVGS